jgi:hypothetical protein
MLDSIRPQFLRGIPESCALMQAGNFVAKLRLQSLALVFGKQRMVTIPVAFLIEGHEQQLTFLD